MSEERQKQLEASVIDCLRKNYCFKEAGDDYFVDEICADYRDKMDDRTAGEILESDVPEQVFYEKLDEWYGDAEWERLCDISKEVTRLIQNDARLFPEGLDDDDERYIEGVVMDRISYDYPDEHYLKQEMYVNIMVDTGDGNYDYTLSSVYPCWYGRYENRIDSQAGIVWLARTQGYTKTALWKALKDGDMAKPHGFLESMRVELANLPSHMSTVTFLVKMTFRQLMDLNTALHCCDRAHAIYGRRKRFSFGHIILGKETMTGLYDPWSGGGSVFEIELERDVKLPLKYIRCAMPDNARNRYEYGVGDVYGMCGSAWKSSLKEMRIPKRLWEIAS